MRRRGFLAAVGALSAGCLSAEGDEPEPPTGSQEYDGHEIRSSLGSAEPLEVTDRRDQSFEFDDGEVVARRDGNERRISVERWEDEVCWGVGFAELRDALDTSVGIEGYSHVVQGFGEVSGEVFESYDGATDGLAERGVGEGDESLVVQHVTVVGDDGSAVRTPALGYDELVGATPESVRVTVGFDGGTDRVVECPVVVWKTVQER